MKKIDIIAKLFLITVSMFIFESVFAQKDCSISGNVKDFDTKKVLVGANIALESTQWGDATNEKGKFKITGIKPGNYTLKITYLGYHSQKKNIRLKSGQKLEIAISLISENILLPTIVIKEKGEKEFVPYAKSKVIRADIESTAARDIGDYIRSIPNISAVKKGGAQLDPVVRGFKYDQVNVRIDGGIRIEGGCPNRMDPSMAHVDIDDIDNIEIVKGPYALKYGPMIGGFINLVTTKPEPFLTKRFEIKAKGIKSYESNWNGTKDHINIKAGNNKIYFNLAGNHLEYGNYKDGNGNQVNSNFRKYSTTVEMGAKPFKKQELILSYVNSQGRNVHFIALPMDERIDDTWIFSGKYIFKDVSEKIKMITVKGFNSNVHHVMDNKERAISDTVVAISTIDAITTGFGVGLTLIPAEKMKIIIGGGAENTDKYGTRIKKMYRELPVPSQDSSSYKVKTKNELLMDAVITNIAGFAEFEKKFKTLNIIAAVRLDINKATSDDTIQVIHNGVEYFNETESQYTNFSFNLGANKKIGKRFTLGAAVGRSTRSPNMIERYIKLLPTGFDKYDYLGNPQLKPETNNQADLTLRFFDENIGGVELGGFYSYLQDYIYAREIGTAIIMQQTKGVLGVKYFYNVDKVIFRGIEFSYVTPNKYKLGGQIVFGYTKATIFEPYDKLNKISGDDALPEIPPFETFIQLYYKFLDGKFVPKVSARIVGKQDYVSKYSYVSKTETEKESPGFSIADFSLNYVHNRNLTVSGGITNIFDEAYYEHLNRRIVDGSGDFYEPGRTFFINLIINI